MKEYYKLTSPQKNIYLREEYYKGTPINNISFTYYIYKKLDIEICKKVINKIIENNDGLRICIKSNTNIKQYIKEYEYQEIDVFDCSNKKMDDIRKIMQEDAQIPFDFENEKLYVFKIYILPEQKVGIYIKLHHIIADAWVTKVILKQFNELFALYEQGQEIEIEKHSYIDFIKKEEEYFESDSYIKDKMYWESYLKDIPEPIQFKDVYQKQDSKAIRYTKYLSEKLSKDINSYCKKYGITPYALFMSVYAIYLYKTLGKTNFTIGTPLLNRKDFIEKQMIGMFVSTIPMKIKIEENYTIKELCKEILIDIKNALKHQRYPYEKMLEFSREINNNSNNLFDTILSFQNIKPDNEYIDYKYNHFWNFSGSQQSSFEIHISDYNNEGKYLLNLDFKKNIVSEQETALVFDRIECIFENILEDDTKLIKDIEFIPLKEVLDLKYEFNKEKKYNISETLIDLFEKQCNKNANKVAVKFKNKKLTYYELEGKINLLACNLEKSGIKENTPVVLLLDRSLEMIISMLAVLKLGAYYIPIAPEWPEDRVNYIVKDSGSKFVITHKKYEDKVKSFNRIYVDENLKNKSNEQQVYIENKSKINGYSYVIYTSGTTGKPKGTLMTHKNVVGLLNSTHRLFKQSSSDIWTLFHTYTFDFSAWEIYGCLTSGGTLIIVPKETTTDPKELLDLLIKEKVTILNQTPAYFYKVIEQEKITQIERKSLKVRLVILGGEAVHAEPLKYWKQKYEDIVIYNGYGPTETTIFAIMCEITKKDIEDNNIYIGYPLDNYKIQILDKNMKMLPIGCTGEICISGIGVCSGYLGNKELTNEKFIYDETENAIIYKSGDVGYFDIDGRVKYIGRNDNQVKIRGFRIEIEEIEKQILNCGDITKVVVMPVENDNFTKSLVGFIETQKADYVAEVINRIKKHLTSYMIPRLYQVKEFPLNNNGKIDRRKLLENIKETKKEIVKPKGDLQNEIYKTVIKVSKNRDVSVKDDFFTDLGLDSLDIMQLATMMNNYGIGIQDISENSNIEDLAKAIQDKKILKKQNKYQYVNIINRHVDFDISSVLLTGVTGFLGIHILRELIRQEKTENIYCLIREKNNILPEKRMEETIKYYFTNEDKKYLNKIKVVNGDFEKENLGLSEDEIRKLNNNVKTIIHSGANVSHYGKYEKFYKTNVKGTKNVINFAKKINAKLAHISTVSVGGYTKLEKEKLLNENNINIEQEFKNHVYMITKYEAECEVLKAISKNDIEAKIFRLGNIMPRVADGLFQINVLENGFISRLRTIFKTKTITRIHSNLQIDLSPVDLCAESIIKLMLNNKNNQTIYHIYNNNLINIKDIIKQTEITEINVEEQIKIIEKLNEPLNAHLLNDLMNNEYIETKVQNDLTMEELYGVGFSWNKIDKSYLRKIIGILEGVNNEKIEIKDI